MRLLGTEPDSLGRWIPQAMGLVFKNCGEFSVESGAENELAVHLRALPLELATNGLWLRSLATGMTPLFSVCGCDGRGELVEMDTVRRCARYRLTWKGAA